MNFPGQDLSLRHISQSYQTLLQTHGDYVLDGLGNAILSVGQSGSSGDPISLLQSKQTASMTVASSSYAQVAVYASSSLTSVFSEYSDSASVAVYADIAALAATASFAQTASITYFAISASYAPGAPSISSSYSDYAESAKSASYALTASYVAGLSTTSSYSIFSETSSHSPNHIKKSGDTATGDIIGTDFVKTRSGNITRDGNGNILSVALTGGRTINITRTAEYISSITDGARTWTYARNSENLITGWAVT